MSLILRYLRIFHLIFTVLLMSVCATAFGAEKAPNILIIANGNEGPYAEVIKGFKAQLSGAGNIQFIELIKPQAADIKQRIAQQKPDIILALGTGSIQLAQQNSSNIPVLSTLVLTEDEFKRGRSSGVSLTYAFATQIEWLKKFFPDQTKVAVLFNPVENTKTVQKLKKAAELAGFILIAIPVESPRQLPDALEQLANNVEILLAIPDEIALSPNTIKEVMLASFRNRVPLVGLSDNWVKSGALYALTWNYDDLGRQCAEQAQKLIKGHAIDSIQPEKPRKTAYSINMKIAEHLNIDIPEMLIKNAKTIFE